MFIHCDRSNRIPQQIVQAMLCQIVQAILGPLGTQKIFDTKSIYWVCKKYFNVFPISEHEGNTKTDYIIYRETFLSFIFAYK